MSQFPQDQPQYSGPPVYHGPPAHTTYSTESMVAEKTAQLSLIFGIIGLFFFGLVFGPLAIWQASKAEKMNKPATAGKVLGWIALVFGIGQIILFFVVIGGLLAIGGASY
ncbi:hypothetical protein [Georgenia sunbinii]|uniref:hypothetical protein n=1 Tax=Georgenia sunbinii TaxID=3117728 RepID=UPI002F26618D